MLSARSYELQSQDTMHSTRSDRGRWSQGKAEVDAERVARQVAAADTNILLPGALMRVQSVREPMEWAPGASDRRALR